MPLRHRTHSAALATASDWIFNYMIVQITPVAISNIRWKTYMIFFVLNIVFAVVVFLFYPETSGRTLEEIDNIYLGDYDRLLVVDKRGSLLPGFRSQMHRWDDVTEDARLENASQEMSSSTDSQSVGNDVSYVKATVGEIRHIERVEDDVGVDFEPTRTSRT
jgi:hypothetical protein